MKYHVNYNKRLRQYLVINIATGIAQSAWKSLVDAYKVTYDLNKGCVCA